MFVDYNLSGDELLAQYQAKIVLRKYCKVDLKMPDDFLAQFMEMMERIIDE